MSKRQLPNDSSSDRPTTKFRNDDGTPPSNPNPQPPLGTPTNATPNNTVNTGNPGVVVNNAQTTANSSVQQTTTGANSIPLFIPATQPALTPSASNQTPSNFSGYLAMAAPNQTQGSNTTTTPVVASKPPHTVTPGNAISPGVVDNKLQSSHTFSPSNPNAATSTINQPGLANIAPIQILKPSIPPPIMSTKSASLGTYNALNPGLNQTSTIPYYNFSANTIATSPNLSGDSKGNNMVYSNIPISNTTSHSAPLNPTSISTPMAIPQIPIVLSGSSINNSSAPMQLSPANSFLQSIKPNSNTQSFGVTAAQIPGAMHQSGMSSMQGHGTTQIVNQNDAPATVDADFIQHLLDCISANNPKVLRSTRTYGKKERYLDIAVVIPIFIEHAHPQANLPLCLYQEYLQSPLQTHVIEQTTNVTIVVPRSGDWNLTWAAVGVDKKVLKGLEDFLDSMIENLFIPVRYSGSGPRTGEPKKKKDRQKEFRVQLDARDKSRCAITGIYSHDCSNIPTNEIVAALEGAHIIPHHLHKSHKVNPRKMLAMFGGADLLQKFDTQYDTAANGMLMDLNCHAAFDMLHWSIQFTDGKYRIRVLHKPLAAGTSTRYLKEDNEIVFRGNPPPDPELCNLHFAIASVVWAIGLADIFNEMDYDDEDPNDPVLSNTDENMELERKETPFTVPHRVPEAQIKLGSETEAGYVAPKAASNQPSGSKGSMTGRPRSDSCGSEESKRRRESYNQGPMIVDSVL